MTREVLKKNKCCASIAGIIGGSCFRQGLFRRAGQFMSLGVAFVLRSIADARYCYRARGITRVLGTEIEIAGKCATRAALSDQ